MGPQRVVAGLPLACPMPEQGAKLTLAEEANSHRKPLEADAGQKMPIGAPRSRLQVGARSVLPAVDERGADRPRLASSLLQSKRDGTAMWGLPGRPLGVWEPSPGVVPQGPLPLPTDLPASASQRG